MSDSDNPNLSIIILNYNVRELLLNCLESIFKNKTNEDNWQIIVVDNASEDGSVEAVKEKYKVIGMDSRFRGNDREVEIIRNKQNLGFSAGNNTAIPKIRAPVVLFLNPDTVIFDDVIQKSLDYLLSNPDIGALTCRVELPNGKLDYSCHRGFPTPWNSFAYFSGLSKMFPKSPFFARYPATYLDLNKPHEIDCLTGAYLMVRKIAGDSIGWWDTDYFWNGEDIEFCFNLKEKGWKIYFYPEGKIIHYKGSSSGLKDTVLVKVDRERRLKAVSAGTSAMKIFYKKHYFHKYPPVIRDFILLGIKSLEQYRRLRV